MNTAPLLSICIPTFNRAQYLDESLSRLTAESAFTDTDKIEIIISDNCSPDNTQEVCLKYTARFPNKISYSRNSTNTGMMANFSNMLKKGRGKFLKLQNDNFILKQGALDRILGLIEKHAPTKPLIFFTNQTNDTHDAITECRTADEFLRTVSILTTWIGGFGIWHDDFDWLWPVFEKNANNLEPNTSVLWALFAERKHAVICQNKIYEDKNACMRKKVGFNPAEAFIRNYPAILREHMGKDGISKTAYNHERMIAYWHGFWWYFDFNKLHSFQHGGFWACSREFHRERYFWISMLCYLHQKFIKRPRRLLGRFIFTYIIPAPSRVQKINEKLSLLIS